MMSLTHPDRKSTIALLILIAAGYAGNYFNLSLFFGVDVLFGGIAVWLVVRFFGVKWGTLAAIIASSHTVFLWNHPYAAIILICETLFAGLLLRRSDRNMVLLDVIYWVFVGIPLVWLFYSRFLHLDSTQIWLIVFKQAGNGIFNALVASLSVTVLPIHKWVGRPQVNNAPSLQHTLLNLLVAFVVFPALLFMVVDGDRLFSNIETEIQVELQSVSAKLNADLQSWHQQHLRALGELAAVAAESDIKPSDMLQQSAKLIQRTLPDFHNLYVADAAAKIIASYPTIDAVGKLTIGDGVDNNSILKQTQTTLQPSTSDVYADRVLSVPHVDLTVPIVIGDRFAGFACGSLDFSYIKKLLKSHTTFKGWQIALVDKKGRLVASTQPERRAMQRFDRIAGGEIRSINGNLYQRSPVGGTLPMLRWQQSLFVSEIPITGIISATLIVEVPAAPYINYAYNLFLKDLAIMLLIVFLATLFAIAIGRFLASPLSKLARVTTNLPDKLLEREAIKWPNSPVTEINFLVRNFKLMAIALEEKLREIQNANETLECRVEERTSELLHANQQFASEIAESKRLQAQLSRREKVLYDYFENGPIGLHWVGEDGEIMWANRAELELLGYSREEYVGHHIANFHADKEVIDDILQRLTAKETLRNYEARLICKDGSIKYVLINSNVFWEDGRFIHTRCFTRDITDRKLAELALHKSEQKNHALLDAIPDLMFCVSQDGTITDFKAAKVSELYVPPSEFLGKKLQEVLPPTVAQQAMSCVEQALSTGEGQIFEYRLPLNDEWRDFEARIVACTYDEVLSIIRDITDRKQAELALRESEEKFRQMAENIDEVLWMKDLNTNQLLYVSPVYEKIWGRTCEGLYEQPKSWLDTIHLSDRDRAIAACDKVLLGECDMEYRIVQPNGSLRWIRDRAFPIRNESGEIYRIFGIAEDITSRQQASEEIIYLLEKERQLNDLKSRFITTASHEFRTPLTTIHLSAELLEHYGHKSTEEKKRTYLNRIQVAAKHMTQLLNDILTIDEAEAGKLEFHPSPLDLEKFCRHLVEEMQKAAGSKHAIVFISQGLCSTASLDEQLLRYILTNLLSNAIKYSPQGGDVNFNLTCDRSEAIFQIQDRGIGIPSADQPQVFKTFHRGSNISTISGTGVGLSIVKKCVDLHGGKIALNSEVGSGSTFTVRLPYHQ